MAVSFGPACSSTGPLPPLPGSVARRANPRDKPESPGPDRSGPSYGVLGRSVIGPGRRAVLMAHRRTFTCSASLGPFKEEVDSSCPPACPGGSRTLCRRRPSLLGYASEQAGRASLLPRSYLMVLPRAAKAKMASSPNNTTAMIRGLMVYPPLPTESNTEPRIQ